jgi:dimethylglycine catabolism A
MTTPYRRLFEPITIGSRTAKNRIVSSAHATGYGEDGRLSDRYVDYHARKAEGGVGTIITFGSASVHRGSAASYGSIRLWDPANEPYLRELARRAHEHGALIMSQATHMGRRGNTLRGGGPLHAPGALPEPVHREIPHVMSTTQIQDVIEAFGDAAERLEACGWDGIEITSFGGHLIEQFWSPVINRRTDQFGGDFNGRMRFAEEVVRAVTEVVSDDFLIGFRMTGDPMTEEGGLNREDMLEIAQRLDSLGQIHLFNISGGTGATLASQAATVPPVFFPPGCYNHLAHAMKEVVSVPVLVAGRILTPEQAEAAIANGDCDLVAMTRAIIADPDLPKRAQAGEAARIRPCLSINEDCIGRLYTGLPMRCTVNPAVADDSLRYTPALRRKRVVIVGGGPAGMETARVAAERGHRVLLVEAQEELGGQLLVAARAEQRPLFDRYAAWLGAELERLGVEVRSGQVATAETVLAAEPDLVVVATGSQSVVPAEARRLNSVCSTDVDLLAGRMQVEPGSAVVVYDREGHARGGSAALFAASAGAGSVELVTDLLNVCEELDPTQKPSMYRLLAQHGVRCTTSQALVGERDSSLVLREAWSDRERLLESADLIVFVGYLEARAELADKIRSRGGDLSIQVVGDALAPRRLHDAVAEGIRAGGEV